MASAFIIYLENSGEKPGNDVGLLESCRLRLVNITY